MTDLIASLDDAEGSKHKCNENNNRREFENENNNFIKFLSNKSYNIILLEKKIYSFDSSLFSYLLAEFNITLIFCFFFILSFVLQMINNI